MNGGPLDPPLIPDLRAALCDLTRQIPAGMVTTFGDLAEALGDVRAARWVATELARWRRDETASKEIAWWRVVRRTGELARGTESEQSQQIKRLRSEGLRCSSIGKLELKTTWRAFQTERPLESLAAWQNRLSQQAEWRPSCSLPQCVGAVDLSYGDDETAVAAYVEWNLRDQSLTEEFTLRSPVSFPYIPGYLTFRETPPLLELLAAIRRHHPLPEVVLVDGTGRLHPRRSGIAVAVGVLAGVTTIGVAKHQLCGSRSATQRVLGCETIVDQGETIGAVLKDSTGQRSLYVSSGQGLDLESAVAIVRATWTVGKLPGPIGEADRRSRRLARSGAATTWTSAEFPANGCRG